tara:strand:+ start:90 stop:698 length:609 start_codon:yes stop_codon:yes gene_type:complete
MKSIITNLIEDYNESASYWAGSIFESVTHFSTDYKGKFGEELLFNLIKKLTNIPVEWDADSNTDNDDGVYDLFWTTNGIKKRVEVKTSGRTVSNGKPIGWQHENVYYEDNKWDNVVFLDYDANDVMFVTVVDYDQIVTNNTIDLSLFGKSGHKRKNEEGKAKVDFSMKSIKNGIDKGLTFEYDLNNPDDEGLTYFLEEKLGK